MKKLRFFWLVLFVYNLSFGQNLDSSDLKKYSYLIFGFYDVHDSSGFKTFKSKQGTCFFAKYHNKVFLISAKHTLLPLEGKSSTIGVNFPDTLKVRMEDTLGNNVYHNLDTHKIIDAISSNFLYNDPDVFIIEFEGASRYKLNTIEDFLTEMNENIENILTFGYPAIQLTPRTLNAFIKQEPVLTIGKVRDKNKIGKLAANDKKDKTTYLIERNNSLIKQGCSGSPVFYKSTTLGKWKFGGVFVKSGIDNLYAEIVKPEFILQLLKSHY